MQDHPAIRGLNKYLDKKVSLLSTSDVRYIGELNTADPDEPSISLKNVRCLGTENRRTGDQMIKPSNSTYEFIRFRANNIQSLHLLESDQETDLNKEILEPLRRYSDSTHNQQVHSSSQRQQMSNKSNDKRNKPLVADEPKRKVGVSQQSNRNAPYDYYSSQQSPQYPPTNRYDHGIDGYPPLPSPHQYPVHSPNYHYDDPNYSQNANFGQIPPQPQSSYYSRNNPQNIPIDDAQNNIPPNEYYQQRPNYPPQYPLINSPPQGYNVPHNYNNYGQFQQNANRPRYPNNRNPEQRYRGGHGGRGGKQINQRYYNNNPNLKQGPTSGTNRPRYNEVNQIPGTGAYLDRRLRDDDLNISTTDFNFGSNTVIEKKSADDKKNDDNKDVKNQNPTTDNENKDNTTSASTSANTGANTKSTTNETEKNQNQTNEKQEDKKNETTTPSGNQQPSTTENETKEEKSRKLAYDKNKSFFDSITTDADIKKQQKQVDLEQLRNNDAETFGKVAETYRSRHVFNQQNNENNTNNNYRNNQRNFNQRKNDYSYVQQQQKYSNNYRPRFNNNQFNQNNQPRNNFFQNINNFNDVNNQHRWVQKRIN